MIVDDLLDMLARHGNTQYGGEAVTQRQHALQCAHLAEDCAEQGVDDAHEHRGERLLAPHFQDAVVPPLQLHVDAKRYLCRVDPAYMATLSQPSIRSLELQGGPYDEVEADGFARQPFAEDAVRLRRYDDRGKDPAAQTPDLEHFRPHLESTLLDTTQARTV